MTALGIDLGGTKIEAQLFDGSWSRAAQHRMDTPSDYPALVGALTKMIQWADDLAGEPVLVGVGAAGLLNPTTGVVIAGNLASHGQTLPSDLNSAAGRAVTYLNDSKALALSEAVFGSGKSHPVTLSLVLGTGVSAGMTRAGQLHAGPTGTGGEVGHLPIGGAVLSQYDLPLLPCTCGKRGCYETFISGPGLVRLGQAVTGQTRDAPDWSGARRSDRLAQRVWAIWCALTADLLYNSILICDPDCIILGGGLSKVDGIVDDLRHATSALQFEGFPVPIILLAEGGDSSGARGAAYAAWQAKG